MGMSKDLREGFWKSLVREGGRLKERMRTEDGKRKKGMNFGERHAVFATHDWF